MSSAQDIIQDAAEKLGVYAPGETITAADAARGLAMLNDMVNQWADEYLYVYQLVPTNITLVGTQGVYTIGLVSGSTINQQRPVRIETGPGAAFVAGTPNLPVNVVSGIEWASIESIGSGAGSPDTLFYNPTYPNGTLNVAPVPTGAGTLTFQAWQPIRVFTALNNPASTVSFAAGNEETLKLNLAVMLKTYFRDAPLDPVLAQQAQRAKIMMQHTNMTSRAMLGREARMMQPLARPA